MTLLSPKQAAEQSAVPERVIHQAMDAGALAHITIGKQKRIHPADLEAWWNRNRIKAWDFSPSLLPLRSSVNQTLAPQTPAASAPRADSGTPFPPQPHAALYDSPPA